MGARSGHDILYLQPINNTYHLKSAAKFSIISVSLIMITSSECNLSNEMCISNYLHINLTAHTDFTLVKPSRGVVFLSPSPQPFQMLISSPSLTIPLRTLTECTLIFSYLNQIGANDGIMPNLSSACIQHVAPEVKLNYRS